MRTDDLDYPFDHTLIAKAPAEPRDAARLLVYHRISDRLEERQVRDLPEYLGAGDALVVNETTVAPARIKAERQREGEGPRAQIEGLLLERRGPRTWFALLRNTKRVKEGERLRLIGPHEGAPSPEGAGLRFLGREGEGSLVEVEGGGSADEVLEALGWTPLPPYILRARGDGDADGREDDADRRRYQTVFAAPTDAPSVAAPTAGLHFTGELFQALAARGVERIPISLQVGAGTFKPVETERLEDHPMHTERCRVAPQAIALLQAARARAARRAGRTIAVGTTAVRTLESMPSDALDREPPTHSLEWSTNILIAPGHRFRLVDALLTNFHLPRSTLLALVAAFLTDGDTSADGLATIKRLYAFAIARRYRFYSYGDAMLIL